MKYFWSMSATSRRTRLITVLLLCIVTVAVYGCAASATPGVAPVAVPKPVPINIQIPKPLRTPETPADDAILELIQGAMKAASAGIMGDETAAAAALGLQIQPSKIPGGPNQIIAGIPTLDSDTMQRIRYGAKPTGPTQLRWGFTIDLHNHSACLTRERIEAAIGKPQSAVFGHQDSKYAFYRYNLESGEEKITAGYTSAGMRNGMTCVLSFGVGLQPQVSNK